MCNKTNKAASRLKAIKLLDEWLSDESGYDEVTWPEIKNQILSEEPINECEQCEAYVMPVLPARSDDDV